jgi:hypothetical protein
VSYAPQKALVDVEELDAQTTSVPLSIDGILSSVDAASTGLANASQRRLNPTDRASLLAYRESVCQVARSLTLAAEQLHVQAARLECAGLLAYHRAPLPKTKTRQRRR